MKAEIAYVDDDTSNLECIKMTLDQDFLVQIFQGPEAFFAKFETTSFKSILIDVDISVMDSHELYKKIITHPHYNGCPILFITSDDSYTSRIKSFEVGAVDFLDRSIEPVELIARVKSRVQFFQKNQSIIEFSNLKVNLILLKAYIDDKELPLTFIEFKILCMVIRNYSSAITKEMLIQQVWRAEHVLDATIYTHLSNLNSKLGEWDFEISGLKSKGIQLVKKART